MHPIYPFSLKPEYVDEMTVDAETEIKHKAGCVWKLLGSCYTQVQLERYAHYMESLPIKLCSGKIIGYNLHISIKSSTFAPLYV
jgi:hypothetical protein